ncbi:hypothetical protein GPJ56_000803 [Histomonas meleagridis]|uniref:uncharacterized protein n=1 Tax=Histomonas meleagridis TaxID=135588 RepID=UPI0035597A77|nr:hypothetical protein GPJ56_000803 [Histomonas meleagridis]KAH0804438.1 hypothetical protein GO595_003268 [Histomonas meleagridis]
MFDDFNSPEESEKEKSKENTISDVEIIDDFNSPSDPEKDIDNDNSKSDIKLIDDFNSPSKSDKDKNNSNSKSDIEIFDDFNSPSEPEKDINNNDSKSDLKSTDDFNSPIDVELISDFDSPAEPDKSNNNNKTNENVIDDLNSLSKSSDDNRKSNIEIIDDFNSPTESDKEKSKENDISDIDIIDDFNSPTESDKIDNKTNENVIDDFNSPSKSDKDKNNSNSKSDGEIIDDFNSPTEDNNNSNEKIINHFDTPTKANRNNDSIFSGIEIVDDFASSTESDDDTYDKSKLTLSTEIVDDLSSTNDKLNKNNTISNKPSTNYIATLPDSIDLISGTVENSNEVIPSINKSSMDVGFDMESLSFPTSGIVNNFEVNISQVDDVIVDNNTSSSISGSDVIETKLPSDIEVEIDTSLSDNSKDDIHKDLDIEIPDEFISISESESDNSETKTSSSKKNNDIEMNTLTSPINATDKTSAKQNNSSLGQKNSNSLSNNNTNSAPKQNNNTAPKPSLVGGTKQQQRPAPAPITKTLSFASRPVQRNESEFITYVKSFFTEQKFEKIKREKETGALFTDIVDVPPNIKRPWRISQEDSDLFVDLINELNDITNLSDYTYDEYLKYVEACLHDQVKSVKCDPIVADKEQNVAEIEQIKFVINISDEILKKQFLQCIA